MEGQVQHFFTASSTGFGCRASEKACTTLCSEQVFYMFNVHNIKLFRRLDRRFADTRILGP